LAAIKDCYKTSISVVQNNDCNPRIEFSIPGSGIQNTGIADTICSAMKFSLTIYII